MKSARVILRVATAAAVAIVGLYSTGSLAGNMTLTVDGIATPIEVLSFKVGASNVTTIGGGGTGGGKVVYTEFLVTAPESAASPLQLLRVNNGQHAATARLQVLSSNGLAPISEWTFETIVFTSLTVESGAADPKAKAPNTFLPPQTSFGMAFGKFCYRVFGSNGSVARETCWDLTRNVAG
jgi:hypothetical protein